MPTQNSQLKTRNISSGTQPSLSPPTRPLVFYNSNAQAQYYTHDGNKNVSVLTDSTQSLCAHYAYAPFGTLLSSSGSSATTNLFRVRKAVRRMSSSVKCLENSFSRRAIANAIIGGNIGMDQEDEFASTTEDALPLHYNRMLDQSPIEAIRKFIRGVKDRRDSLDAMKTTTASGLPDIECRMMIRSLGQLTHMLQDYYGHGVGWDYVVGSSP